jgi:hypothetical protein
VPCSILDRAIESVRIGRVTRGNGIKRTSSFVLCAFVFSLSAVRATPELTLDDLRKLEIICFVPSHLPKDFRLQRVDITYDELHVEFDDMKHQLPLYSIVYSNDPRRGGTFSIESAREGIGDRNITVEEDTEETEIQTPLGAMYLIYRPKGKDGRKDEILTNWVSDANMNAEKAKGAQNHPVLGRYHGFSATGITVAEFTKIVQSLHPIRDEEVATPAAAQSPALKIHPKVFSMINCWISDSESPVVTEINLDAVEKNENQFNQDGLTQDGEWLKCPVPDTNGFMRYRLLESKGNHYKIEYQENGGGTLTTASVIEFDIDKRNIQRDGKPLAIRVLRVSSYTDKLRTIADDER